MKSHSMKKQLLQYLVLRLVQILIVSTVNTVNIIIIVFLCVGKVVVSTGIVENMAYAGLVYYEKKEGEDLATFAAAKDLNALLEVYNCPYIIIIVTFCL